VSRNAADAGNVVGNVYDKYGTTNPIARRLMQGFLDAVTELYRVAAPASVLEVGCGEGELAAHLWRQAAAPCSLRDLRRGHRAPRTRADRPSSPRGRPRSTRCRGPTRRSTW
jgi:ubiquinone/menaquinone biosynthesis C-methylase UbiE